MNQNSFMQALVCLAACMLALPLAAQEEETPQEVTPQEESPQEDEAVADGTQSGYGDIKQFGGPESVGVRLKENDADREADYMFDNLQRGMKPYFDWKRDVKDDHGVSFGTSFYVLYQKASDALDGEDDDALGHVFRQQGAWEIFKKDNGNSGRIAWRIERDQVATKTTGIGPRTGRTPFVQGGHHLPLALGALALVGCVYRKRDASV